MTRWVFFFAPVEAFFLCSFCFFAFFRAVLLLLCWFLRDCGEGVLVCGWGPLEVMKLLSVDWFRLSSFAPFGPG